ncbi:MAG: hypothetical protein F6K09_03855 [Merismopedia sp. SIO2A8]|nr:hypothetical protein [Merismopedia sp. SIO2A8]
MMSNPLFCKLLVRNPPFRNPLFYNSLFRNLVGKVAPVPLVSAALAIALPWKLRY